MIIDPPFVLRRERISRRTSVRFTHLAETIGRAYEPANTQIDALQRAYESTGEFLVACPEFDGLMAQVHAHGSRQLGAMVRPSQQRDGWDIDLVARLTREALQRYGGEQGAALLLRHLFTALERYAARHDLAIERHERCVTLVYAGGMRADFAPVIDDPLYGVLQGEHHGRIPDRELRRYLSTNPRGYCLEFDRVARIPPNFPMVEKLAAEFNEARRADVLPLPDPDTVFGRLASRYVQAGKIHRNVAFASAPGTSDLRPPSFFLTSLIASGYARQAPQPHDGPLDLFQDIVEHLHEPIQRYRRPDGTEHWELFNPTAQHDNLAAAMNDPAMQAAFWAWHARLRADLCEIQEVIEQQRGLDEVLRVVERAFGRPAATALATDNSGRREAQRNAGRSVYLAAGTTPVAAAAVPHTYFGG